MYPANKSRKAYRRPESMLNAISFEKVNLDPRTELQEVTIEVPAAVKIQPAGSYRLYDEPDTVQNPGTNVVCSGTALMISEGGPTGSARMIGILKNDAAPGDVAVCQIEGEVLLPAPDSLSNADALKGAPAFYDTATGLIQTATAAGRLKVGYFSGGFYGVEPGNGIISGEHYVSVMLQPEVMQANTAVALPADASLTNSAAPFVDANISDFSGLVQNLLIEAASPNPNYASGDLDLVVTVEGTEVYNGPFMDTVPATFTAGAGKTVAVQVTDPAANTATANYTVTISASAAPSAWSVA